MRRPGEQSKRQYEVTKEVQALRYLRTSAKLSLREVGRRMRWDKSTMCHIESGRMRLSDDHIEPLVRCMGFTLLDLQRLLQNEVVPVSVRDECLALIRTVDDQALQIIYPVLLRFKT